MLQSQTEYVTVPPGIVRDSPRTNSPVTQITPGFGGGLGDLVGDLVGVGVGDFVGLGDFVGDGLGLLVGVVLLDGLGLCVGFELFVGAGVGVFVGLADWVGSGGLLGLADLDGAGVELGLGVTACGLIAGTFRPDELGLAEASASGSTLARTTCADAVPHTALSSDLLGEAITGATVGPASRNSPAPAATATCPTRTILTGTTALR